MPEIDPLTARRLVTIKEAQRIVNVSRRTIYNWLGEGLLDTCRTAGGSVRISVDSLFRKPYVRKTTEVSASPDQAPRNLSSQG